MKGIHKSATAQLPSQPINGWKLNNAINLLQYTDITHNMLTSTCIGMHTILHVHVL